MLDRLIKLKSCDVFTFYLNWTLPTTPSVSFTVSPNLTFFKCPIGGGAPDKQIEDFFRRNHNYSYYKGCSGYTVYYKYPDDPHQSLPINERFPQSCLVIRLPVFSLNDSRKRNVSDLFSVLDSNFSLGFNVSKECGECHLKGGDRPRYNSAKFQCTEQAKHGTNHRILILGTVLLGGSVFLLCLLIVITWLRKEWNYNSSYISSRDNFSNHSLQAYTEGGNIYFGVFVFSYTELEEATHNFDPTKELGDGGFGTVHHGKLQDGREVAVKRLYEHNYKRVRQFVNEIQILTCLSHPNLVTLYGCTSCLSRELLLVYEYIPNGIVADDLHGDRANAGSLTWPIRMNIAIETAVHWLTSMLFISSTAISRPTTYSLTIIFASKLLILGFQDSSQMMSLMSQRPPKGLLVMLIQSATNATNSLIKVMSTALELCSLSSYHQCRLLTLLGISKILICVT